MIPYEWRRDPNAYQYFFKFKKQSEATDLESSEENLEHVECVICMSKIIYEIDVDGNLINLKQSQPETEMTSVSHAHF